jgi:hypothetical protein
MPNPGLDCTPNGDSEGYGRGDSEGYGYGDGSVGYVGSGERSGVGVADPVGLSEAEGTGLGSTPGPPPPGTGHRGMISLGSRNRPEAIAPATAKSLGVVWASAFFM